LPLVLVLLVRYTALGLLRRRRHLARTPVGRAETAWEELDHRLAVVGCSRCPAWTPRLIREDLVRRWGVEGPAAEALDRLVDELERVRYLPPSGPEADAAATLTPYPAADIELVVRAVTARRPRRVRWVAWLLRVTGTWVLTGWWSHGAGAGLQGVSPVAVPGAALEAEEDSLRLEEEPAQPSRR
jgi:hypothetical protein